jgi:hypothetical protein
VSASRSDGLRAAMHTKLASDDGKACYANRQQTIQPVFGQINEQQGTLVPAPGLAACDAERPAGGQLSRHPGGDAATAARGR